MLVWVRVRLSMVVSVEVFIGLFFDGGVGFGGSVYRLVSSVGMWVEVLVFSW